MRSFAPLVVVALASLAAGIATPAARDISAYPGTEAYSSYYICQTTDCSGPLDTEGQAHPTCSSVPLAYFPLGENRLCFSTFEFRSVGIYAPSNVTSLDYDVRLISIHELGS
jgi:hypothetical protein